jgi:hypothetical protein
MLKALNADRAISFVLSCNHPAGGSSAPEFMMAPGRDMAAMQFSSAAYGVPSFEGNGGFASFSMSNLHNAQASNMLGIAPVTTFMGMLTSSNSPYFLPLKHTISQ